MKLTPNPLFKEMSGKVFGQKEKTSVRMQYGQIRSYTYKNKPAEWSDNQTQMRQLFGAAAYAGRLILKNEQAKLYYEELRRKEQFARIDNYVAKQVKGLCEADAELREQVVAANEAHKKVKGQAQKEAELQAQQMPLVEEIWHRLFQSPAE